MARAPLEEWIVPTKPPVDGLTHTVEDGEWVGSVAIRYGFADWEADVWKHGENASLRDKRKDPHLLAPGDKLFIPAWEEREEECATEERHTFELKTPTEVFRLRVLDIDGEPVANKAYTLAIETVGSGVVFKQQGKTTDGDGMLEEVIPSTARSGRLRVPDAMIDMAVSFGTLYPVDSDEEAIRTRGAQQRLAAIDFYDGEITGELDEGTRMAVGLFQRFCADNKGVKPEIVDAGEVNGELTKATRDALIKYYGC